MGPPLFSCEAINAEGSPDIEFKEDIEGIDEWPHSWPDGEVSYRLNTHTNDIKKQSLQDTAVSVALRAWQIRINKLDFRRERNPDVSVDFDVSFAGIDKFSSANVYAHAWYPGQGKVSGDCEINDDSWNWVTSSRFQGMGKPPLVPILIHEFGHSLGLRHDRGERDAIMYPSYSLSTRKFKLHERDITRIQERYGKRSMRQRWIDYFIRRRDMAWDFD